MGRENATSVDDVTSKFEEGLPVKVMRIGLPWAYDAMWAAHPEEAILRRALGRNNH